MNQLLYIIILLTTSLGIHAQDNRNRKIDSFMNYLSNHGAKMSVSRVNDKYHIAIRYNISFDKDSILAKNEVLTNQNRVPHLVDSICVFFDGMIRNSIESYRYESHKNNKDTISYTIATKGYGDKEDYILDVSRYENSNFDWTSDYKHFQKSHTFLYNNTFFQQELDFFHKLSGSSRKMYFGAKEAGMFDYVNGKGNIIYISNYENKAKGTYYNFDISPLDSTLQSLINSDTNIKQVGVTYKHNAGERSDKESTYFYTRYILPELKGKSESQGQLYIIPASEKSRTAYSTLLKEANRFLDTHLTQCCVLEYSSRHFMLSGIKNTTRLHVNHEAESSLLLGYTDRSGTVYILRLETNGEYWIPRNWQNIKSSINGKTTFINIK